MTGTPVTERKLYTYLTVDHILGLHPGTAQRWINGYSRRGKFYKPIVRELSLNTEVATWGEFVETYYLARFRHHGVPTNKQRQTMQAVKERTGRRYLFAEDPDPLFADATLKEVIVQVQDDTGFPEFLVKRTRQGLLLVDDAAERLKRISYNVSGFAESLLPRMNIDSVYVAGDRFFWSTDDKEDGD